MIGIGTMGSMAAWQLASKGMSVIGFEQFGIGHDRSAAGGESRLFRTAYKEGAQYVPLLQEAKKLWRQLEEETATTLLTLTGGLTIGNPNDDVILNVQKSIKDYQLDCKLLDYEEAKKKYPQHRLLKDEMMILDKEAGFIRPELAVVAAASRAKQLGAEIRSYCTVERIEQWGTKIKVTANGESYVVEKLLITAGPWVTKLIPSFQPFISAKKIILTWFPAEDIRQFQGDRFPVFTRTTEGTRFFGAPTVDHSMVKVGVSLPMSIVNDVDHLNRTVELQEIEKSRALISKYFNGLYPDPTRTSAYMDAYTADDHSIIGNVPDLANAYVFGGFSGHGFKMAPALGKLAASLLSEETHNFTIDQLSPTRFTAMV
ncbi:N-methyltryptophan oxidase [Bacillus sp. MRMR6]|nr:N-methyltryptophan oxidase [Bacillus sp. MRMR6]